jgi:uncharacterized membrane protein
MNIERILFFMGFVFLLCFGAFVTAEKRARDKVLERISRQCLEDHKEYECVERLGWRFINLNERE